MVIPASIRDGIYGVLGHNIAYSQSPLIFRRVFDALDWSAVYARFDLPARRIRRFLAATKDAGIVGVNVTQPHKERVASHLDRVDSVAKTVGAVNTIAIANGRLTGYNTDVAGVYQALKPHTGLLCGGGAVILGAGGAARAVAHSLIHDFGMSHLTFAVRSLVRGRRLIRDLADQCPGSCAFETCALDRPSLGTRLMRAALLVNATPLGGGALRRQSPLPAGVRLAASVVVFDLIYSPRPTRFLQGAIRQGCAVTVDGWPMLIAQAEAAFRIWSGRSFPVETRKQLLSAGGAA